MRSISGRKPEPRRAEKLQRSEAEKESHQSRREEGGLSERASANTLKGRVLEVNYEVESIAEANGLCAKNMRMHEKAHRRANTKMRK